MPTAQKLVQVVLPKTADYTLTAADLGGFFTTRGAAGAVIFTLPAVSASYKGASVEFYNAVDQDMTIAGTAGELITFNDAAANSIAFSTSSEKLGAYVKAVCDGTSWLIIQGVGETQTATVAT